MSYLCDSTVAGSAVRREIVYCQAHVNTTFLLPSVLIKPARCEGSHLHDFFKLPLMANVWYLGAAISKQNFYAHSDTLPSLLMNTTPETEHPNMKMSDRLGSL